MSDVVSCGTDAGYYRHRRAESEVCDECRAAHAAAERERHAARKRGRAEQLQEDVARVDVPAEFDPVEDARENLRLVIAAMKSADPGAVARLSQQRMVLVKFLSEARPKSEEASDQLAKLRDRRKRRAG